MNAALETVETGLAPSERSRRGGRAGKRISNAAAFDQAPFRQLRLPFEPTKLISDDEHHQRTSRPADTAVAP